MSAGKCGRCGERLSEGTKFCGSCGAITASYRAESSRARRASRSELNRSVWALASLMAIPLAVSVAFLSALEPESVDVATLAFQSMIAVAGIVATAILGWRSTEHAMRVASWPNFALALPVALLCFAVSWAYVYALQAGLPDRLPIAENAPSASVAILSTLILAPLLEEWVCRGIAWDALSRISNPASTLLATSAIFAILHGLGGGYFLEFPHRFVAGLGFGWLRLRSGSIWPAVLAHALHNALTSL